MHYNEYYLPKYVLPPRMNEQKLNKIHSKQRKKQTTTATHTNKMVVTRYEGHMEVKAKDFVDFATTISASSLTKFNDQY